MKLEDILAGSDTVMTKELIRLFKVAGCSPTACHVCHALIDVGETFKLVEFKRKDEMCCAKHGKPDLAKRDKETKRDIAAFSTLRGVNTFRHNTGGGYSRPSAKNRKVTGDA